MKKIIMLILIIFVAVSCTMKNLVFVPINIQSQTKTDTKYVKNYEVNKTNFAGMGASVLQIKKVITSQTPAYISENDFELPLSSKYDILQPMKVKKDDYYYLRGKSDSGLYICTSLVGQFNVQMIEIDDEGRIRSGACLLKTDKMYAYWRGEYKDLTKFKPTIAVKLYPSDYEYDLTYVGFNSNALKINAVEKYLGNVHNQQTLEFNISDDKIISYRSIKIKITDVSNSGIEFMIIDEGDLSWVK